MAFYTDFPVYPTEILDTTDYPDQADSVDDVLADLVNALRDEMIAVQTELGTLPKAGYADIKARLDALSAPQFKVVRTTRDMQAAGGDVTYTGATFTPKAVIGIGSRANMTIGLATGSGVTTDQLSIFMYRDQGAMGWNNAFLESYESAGVNQSAVFKEFTSDGCILTWTKNGAPPPGTFYFALLFFG